MVAKKYSAQIDKATVVYAHGPAVCGVTVGIPSGELLGIIGPNGAGKTTLLKAMVDLIPLHGGEIRMFGQPYSAVRHRVAYVPQRLSVDWDFPLSVEDVVMMGRYPHLGLFLYPSKDDYQIVANALDSVGLTEYRTRHIGALSGGQQQRVFLARAIAQEADLYLMDEPFAGVDIATERLMVSLFRSLCTRGKSVVIVHHNVHDAADYFDSVILLNRSIIAHGKPVDVMTHELLKRTYTICSDDDRDSC